MKELQENGVVLKALTTSAGNDFEMEEMIGVKNSGQVRPRLFSTMFGGGNANQIFLTAGNTVKWDELVETLQIPAGKNFSDYGPSLSKDKPSQRLFQTGSYGFRYDAAPADYSGKRKVGSNELQDLDYVTAKLATKAEKGWGLFDELQMASVITKDVFDPLGGPTPAYNYHNEFVGTTRTLVNTDLTTEAVDSAAIIRNEKSRIAEEAEKAGFSYSRIVCICGEDYFNAQLALAQLEGLARDVKSTIDLASMEVPVTTEFSGKFPIEHFDNPLDGVRYIRYSANIQGTVFVAADKGFLIPVGVESLFKRVYSPAQDVQNCNTTARSMYTWRNEHNRRGVTVAQESNVLIINPYPQMISHLDMAAA